MTPNEQRFQLHIDELESKIAFQEDTINGLSNELLEHQRKIDRLHHQVILLAEKMRNLPDDLGILRPEEEPPPPHY